MNLVEVGGGGGDWMERARYRDRWRALVGTVMNFRVPSMLGISWLAAKPVSFSRRTVLHGVSKYRKGGGGCDGTRKKQSRSVCLSVHFCFPALDWMIKQAGVKRYQECWEMLKASSGNTYMSNKMHSDCWYRRFHPNFSVKIYQLLKKINIQCSHCVWRDVCMLLPPILFVIKPFKHKLQLKWHWHFCLLSVWWNVCVCVSMYKCKNNPLSKQERKNGDGCINKGNWVLGTHSFIIFTLLKLAIGGILIPYALMQHKVTMISISPKLSLYTYFLPTCQTIWQK
jgi:hypothetical protein